MHVAEPFATGVLSFLVDLTRQQVEEYEVYILYGVRPLTPDNVSNLFDKRVHLIKIDSFKGAIGTVFNFKAYRDVRRWYKKIDPDIVHFHSSASGFVGRWALPCKKTFSFLYASRLFFFNEKWHKIQTISILVNRIFFG